VDFEHRILHFCEIVFEKYEIWLIVENEYYRPFLYDRNYLDNDVITVVFENIRGHASCFIRMRVGVCGKTRGIFHRSVLERKIELCGFSRAG